MVLRLTIKKQGLLLDFGKVRNFIFFCLASVQTFELYLVMFVTQNLP